MEKELEKMEKSFLARQEKINKIFSSQAIVMKKTFLERIKDLF